jgi:hypothetical protein
MKYSSTIPMRSNSCSSLQILIALVGNQRLENVTMKYPSVRNTLETSSNTASGLVRYSTDTVHTTASKLSDSYGRPGLILRSCTACSFRREFVLSSRSLSPNPATRLKLKFSGFYHFPDVAYHCVQPLAGLMQLKPVQLVFFDFPLKFDFSGSIVAMTIELIRLADLSFLKR